MRMHALVALVSAWFFASLADAAGLRKEILFDDDWRFTRGDFADAFVPTFDDAAWMTVDTPHDSLGVNAIRTAHHPFNPEVLDYCRASQRRGAQPAATEIRLEAAR